MKRDDSGIHLIDKNRKPTLSNALFSRLGLIVLLLLVQIGLLVAGFIWFKNWLPHFWGGTLIFTVVMILFLVNSSMDPSAKITWLVLVMAMPVFGALLYWYTRSDLGHRALKARYEKQLADPNVRLPQQDDAIKSLKEDCPDQAALAAYLNRTGVHPVFRNTEVEYFPSGEAKFEALLRELEKARGFIFLEYFIIDEGLMWGKVLEVLARKAREGVEVRVMYDGTCEFSTLPHDYPRRLRDLGIKCRMFAPASLFFSTHYNYRDHRKIVVIDGKVAFTGGINLADEYINAKDRFGHWKDTGLLLRGDAVRSFTVMFLQLWNVTDNGSEYAPWHTAPGVTRPQAPGYVIPFGDCPLDQDKAGERVYMHILNRARGYVHITTPYLILDGEMESALKFAAERGIDVSIILPGRPDKLYAWALAKTHYASLLRSGVKLYEYTPGFVHAKVFVSDDSTAVVGTINLDYRSLYHHFECAAYMYKTSCIGDIEADFQKTLAQCRPVTWETIKKEKWWLRLMGRLLKPFAPLM